MSFKEECLKRLDNKNYEQPKVKRRQINSYGDIVTSDAYFEKVFNELEEEKEEKEKKLQKRGKPKKAKAKTAVQADPTSSETEEEIMESSSDDVCVNPELFPETNKEAALYLKNLWETISSPVPENDLINEWYAAVFYNKKKGVFYIGRVTRKFLADVDGPVKSIE